MTARRNAKFNLRVHISRKYIAEAYRLDARKCAIAEALKESDPDIVWANVTTDFVQIGRASDEMRYKWRSTPEIIAFIEAFDIGEGKAFVMELSIDDFVSMRPRQMRQPQRADEVARRRHVAAVTGVDPRRIPREELPVWDSNGEVIQSRRSVTRIGRVAEPPPPRQPRPKRAPDAPVRQYAKRVQVDA